MSGLTAIKNGIIFEFCDKVGSKAFGNTKAGEIVIVSGITDQSGVTRWGQVSAIGSTVKDVKVGDYICIEAGKWTQYFLHNDTRYWKTDEDSILLVDDVPHYYTV